MARVRIGIDVGGTFTDVVLIDNETHELIGQLKLPTTHAAREGVALGIVGALGRAMEHFHITADEVAFIAHSTTQATNALLEGDVAEVGVIGAASGFDALLAGSATAVPPINLTASRSLSARHAFIRAGAEQFEKAAEREIEKMRDQGVRVIVASEAFGVDEPAHETLIAEKARQAGLLATTGHEVSSLYGLRVRTRTAVINAAILPKMIETAEMTARCVSETGIRAPLMIMRSDGGVMSVAEVHRRPILTMLSGPAAGIAGALMHERVSDGVFIEVGGTSADISVIRDGSPVTRPARLNGHRMYLNTLDVRTLGVGGGSMIRVAMREATRPDTNARHIADVGPRSAHIAGLGYACFATPEQLQGATIELITPTAGDAPDHAILRAADGKRYAITTTCAANLLGFVQPGHFACGNPESAQIAFAALAKSVGENNGAERLATETLETACRKIAATIDELIAEYQLERDQVVLVGGGGGAASLVPFAARLMGLQHRIARNAEVISPIGVAMAMVRDTIERNITDPSPEDILAVRRQAAEAAIAAGAVPDSIEVQVEVDKRRNLVRATAMGTTEMRRREGERQEQTPDQCREIAARSMRVEVADTQLAAETNGLLVFTATQKSRAFFGLLSSRRDQLRVLDRTGVARLQRGAASVRTTVLARLGEDMTQMADLMTDFGDAGRAIPDIFILYGARIVNFSGLAQLDQALALAEVEFRNLDPATCMAVIACPK